MDLHDMDPARLAQYATRQLIIKRCCTVFIWTALSAYAKVLIVTWGSLMSSSAELWVLPALATVPVGMLRVRARDNVAAAKHLLTHRKDDADAPTVDLAALRREASKMMNPTG